MFNILYVLMSKQDIHTVVVTSHQQYNTHSQKIVTTREQYNIQSHNIGLYITVTQ